MGQVWLYDGRALFPELFKDVSFGAFRIAQAMGDELLLDFTHHNYLERQDVRDELGDTESAQIGELFESTGIWLNRSELAHRSVARQIEFQRSDGSAGCEQAPQAVSAIDPFGTPRFETRLQQEGSSEVSGTPALPDDPRVREVHYPSGDLALKAWLALPEGPGPFPAVIYLHGGFSLSAGDFADAEAFLEAGFAVLLPMLRSENGNPGAFELWRGEVDDAAAASRWLAQQPDVRAQDIFAFGHSVGGGVAAGLSLHPDAALAGTGGSGGLYLPGVFASWSDVVPFRLDDPMEQRARLLFSNQHAMRRWHTAYVGSEDRSFYATRWVASAAATAARHLEAEVVPGTHFSSLPEAVQRFIERISRAASRHPQS
ncbi:MAG: CocE/NonD family hydrolase [Pseudomonadota bacterium]